MRQTLNFGNYEVNNNLKKKQKKNKKQLILIK